MSDLKVKLPSRAALLDECVRLKAENTRLTRLVAAQRPELRRLRDIEVGLRDYLNNGAVRLQEIHQQCAALLPSSDDDLPSLEEMRGCLSDTADLVERVLSERAK